MHRDVCIGFVILVIAGCMLSGCLSPEGSSRAESPRPELLTEELPPFNFAGPEGTITGSSTDVVREIAGRLGMDAEIELVPWDEGYNRTLSTPGTALFSTARTAERENLFRWVGPIGTSDITFFGRSGSGISLSSLEEAKKAGTIAVVRDDVRHQYLVARNVSTIALYPDDESCVRAVMSGEARFWLGSTVTANQTIVKAGYQPDDLRPLYQVQTSELYIAFNNQTSAETVAAWQDALDGMKRDGTYQAILAQYGLSGPPAAGTPADSGAPAIGTGDVPTVLMALADSRFSAIATSLEVLALTSEAKSGDWEQIRPLLAGLEERYPSARFWYARPDGSYYTTVDNLTTGNLASRSYFPGVLAGNSSVGSVVVSLSTGRTTGIVAVPIVGEGNTVTGVLGSSVYLDSLASDLRRDLPLPATMYFVAFDRDGLTALHSRPEQIGRQATMLGTPEELEAVRTIMGMDEGQVTFASEGVHQTIIFRTSPLTGWKYGIGVEG
ncbi:MAG: transporter substrate-binding domain-containing protein [Methanomicrobiales archaeon]|nr:transporter substrate-binding domain-containing protein [Methanomicrobiales archaeon]